MRCFFFKYFQTHLVHYDFRKRLHINMYDEKRVAPVLGTNSSIPYLVSVAHKVVGGDEGLEHDNPVRVLCTFNQQVGQSRYGYIRLVRAVQQIYKIKHDYYL